MARGWLVAAAAGLIVVLAVVEGRRSNRWGSRDDLQEAAGRLLKVPVELGEWTGTEVPIEPRILTIAEATGAVSRVYTSRKNGDQVTVLLVCGPSGPIGAHTPEICYGGLGYRCVGRPLPRRIGVGQQTWSFWTARFEKPTPTDEPLRIFWGWGVDGDWLASTTPRTDFAWRSVLYKLYAVTRDGTEPGKDGVGTIERFLVEFLPLVQAALQAPRSAHSAEAAPSVKTAEVTARHDGSITEPSRVPRV